VALEKITGTSGVPAARTAAPLTLPEVANSGGFDNPRNNIRDMYINRK